MQYYSPPRPFFSRGIISDMWTHLYPDETCSDCRNIRIKNWTTTVRKWYVLKYKWNIEGNIKKMVVWENGIYGIIDTSFYKFWDTYIKLKENIGDNVNFVRYGKFIFLCNGTSTVNVYNTATNTRTTATLPTGAVISFWSVFQENVWLVGANRVYKSRSWRSDLDNILDFTGEWSDTLTKKSDITGISSLRGKMYLYTETTIEEFTANSIITTGDKLSVYTTPIAGENMLANSNCSIVTDDFVFFWTKWNQLKSLNYKQWFTEISIWNITEDSPIQNVLDRLDENQDQAFWYHHKEKNLLFFFLKEKWESLNNIIIVYDIAGQNMLIDDNKYFSDIVKYQGKYYASNGINSDIYEDEVGNNDIWQPISWSRTTAPLYLWNPNYRKEFREINIIWEKNSLADIDISVSCDGKNIFDTKIAEKGDTIGFASVPTATQIIAGESKADKMTTFEKTITAGSLKSKGKQIKVKFSWKTYGNFCLSNMSIWYRQANWQERTDKLYNL